MKQIVVGIGELLWDMFPEGKSLGGAPANFAWHASHFGLEGWAVSAVGRDALGREILNTLTEKKLPKLVAEVDYPTGTVLVTLDNKGVPVYDIRRDVAWDNILFTEDTERLARNCSAVCFGTLAQRGERSRASIGHFLESVPEGCLKVFDINLRQNYYDRQIVHNSLCRCNILKINEEEVAAVAKIFEIEKTPEKEVCLWLLKEYDLDIVVETKGSEGSWVFTACDNSYMATPRVEVADTVGAGDSFTGAFIAALLSGKPLREAHRLAVDVSAYVCTQQGAMPQLPREITSRIK